MLKNKYLLGKINAFLIIKPHSLTGHCVCVCLSKTHWYIYINPEIASYFSKDYMRVLCKQQHYTHNLM